MNTNKQLRADLEEIMEDATGLIDQYDNRHIYVDKILALFNKLEVEARKEENIYHRDNSDAVFGAIENPTAEQTRIHQGLMDKFNNRLETLNNERIEDE